MNGKKIFKYPNPRNTSQFLIVEKEVFEVSEENVEEYISDYHEFKTKNKKQIKLLHTLAFLQKHNFKTKSYKGFYRSFKKSIFFDKMNCYFGNHFGNYSEIKSLETIENYYSLFLKKNEIVLNTINQYDISIGYLFSEVIQGDYKDDFCSEIILKFLEENKNISENNKKSNSEEKIKKKNENIKKQDDFLNIMDNFIVNIKF